MNKALSSISALLAVVALLFFPIAGAEAQQPYAVLELTGAKGPSDLLVKTVYRDGDGMLWVGTGNSVERFDGNAYVRYSFNSPPLYKEDNSISCIVSTGGQCYWAGNRFGLWKLNHETLRIEAAWTRELKFAVRKLAADNAGNLYIATDNGLYIAGETQPPRRIPLEKGGRGQVVRPVDVAVESPQKVWVTVSGGVVACNPKTGSVMTYAFRGRAMFGNLTCCFRMGQRLYLGTERAGVAVFDLKSLSFTSLPGTERAAVSCLSGDVSTGLLGVGTVDDGLFLYDLRAGRTVYSARYVPGGNGGLLSNKRQARICFLLFSFLSGINYFCTINFLINKTINQQ